MIERQTTLSKSGPMRIESTDFAIESPTYGEVILTRRRSTVGSRTLTSWSLKRPGDVCAIGSFRSAENALSSPFLNRPTTVSSSRPGDYAAIYAEEHGVDYATALVRCNMD